MFAHIVQASIVHVGTERSQDIEVFPSLPSFASLKEKVSRNKREHEVRKGWKEERVVGKRAKRAKRETPMNPQVNCVPHQGVEARKEAGNCIRTVHKCSQYSWFCMNSKFFEWTSL